MFLSLIVKNLDLWVTVELNYIDTVLSPSSLDSYVLNLD